MHRLFTRLLIYEYMNNIWIFKNEKWFEYLFGGNCVNASVEKLQIDLRSVEEIVRRPSFWYGTIRRFFYSLLRTMAATRLPWHYVFSWARLYSTHFVRRSNCHADISWIEADRFTSLSLPDRIRCKSLYRVLLSSRCADRVLAIGIFIISRNRLRSVRTKKTENLRTSLSVNRFAING